MQGDAPAARSMFREGLTVARASGNRRRLAFTLRALAGLAAAEGEPERAIRLDAAGLAATEAMGAKLASAMEAIYQAQLEPARQALGDRALASAFEIGHAQKLEQAVEEALAWLDADTTAPRGGRVEPVAERPEPEPPQPAAADRGGFPDASVLTRRKRDVAALLARGLTNRQIAAELVVTEGTAASYVRRVMDRLGFHTRAQIAVWAVEHHLQELPRGR